MSWQSRHWVDESEILSWRSRLIYEKRKSLDRKLHHEFYTKIWNSNYFGRRILRKRFSPNIFAVIIFALSKDKEVNKPDNVTDKLAW